MLDGLNSMKVKPAYTDKLQSANCRKKTGNYIVDLCCLLLSCLFLYAALSKLHQYAVFRTQLNKSPFISGLASLLAWVLPVIEIIVSAALMIVPLRSVALGASLFLLTLFTAYLSAMLLFSYYIPCSCGGILSGLTWKEHVVFNGTFMLINLIAVFIGADASKNI